MDYGLEASKARSSPTHSLHIAWTLRAFSSNGRIVSGVSDNATLRASCGGRSVGVGGGAERMEPVNRRTEGRRRRGGGLLLLPPSSRWCASAVSSTFDKRVGRMYDDDDDVACDSGSGRGGGGCVEEELVVGGEEAVASETCERESAQSDSED